MTDDRKGGIALIAGSAGMLVTMAFHPSGHDLFQPGQLDHMAHLAVAVHALALASLPVLFLGALALSRRVARPARYEVAGLVLYGFALAAAMCAAVMSGFVGSALAREIVDAVPPSEAWRIVFHYNSHVNQGFAQVYVVASSLAIVLWSAAILRSAALARGVGIYGCVLGPIILLAVLSGHLRLGVHGFGLIVLGQAAWFIASGALLCRLRPG